MEVFNFFISICFLAEGQIVTRPRGSFRFIYLYFYSFIFILPEGQIVQRPRGSFQFGRQSRAYRLVQGLMLMMGNWGAPNPMQRSVPLFHFLLSLFFAIHREYRLVPGLMMLMMGNK